MGVPSDLLDHNLRVGEQQAQQRCASRAGRSHASAESFDGSWSILPDEIMMNDEAKESLEKGLLSTLKNEDLGNVCKDFSELAIDAFLQDGIARDIPIINSILGLAKAGFTVRDRLFIEKVIKFINPLSQYTTEERREFLQSLDGHELKKATESIILYLDRLDSLEKPEMMGKVFESYMKGESSFKAMMYYIHFIDSVFIMVWQDFYKAIENLALKKSHYARVAIDDAKALEVVGIYERVEESEYDLDIDRRTTYIREIKKKLVLTNVGRDFIKVVFGFWVDEEDFWRHSLDVKI